ncbi:methylated-DNA--[protein]-cysteine S-methyltransferase [Microbacterium pseudoresistens]|uniref:Methylated-DNA--protein-cysteine methyltransferase n=1 Tax=Microbacterium pseudoresistens TaxID=640634 RepID=A0A7Y9JMW2_9MICO|nr:methylated-DNA--[protein]-cysteine S-methyltransferase [Microbacterium pseudoresistens]NYD53933.1 methylated-DNA-[protein]-cysteine S-methyltransferase [Microbacterium pseudoresistens]
MPIIAPAEASATARGRDEEALPIDLRRAVLSSPVGTLEVRGNGRAIVGLAWRDRHRPPRDGEHVPLDPVLSEAVGQLRAYFEGGLRRFTVPMELVGVSPVATAVLAALEATVAPGDTVTYGELARRSGTDVPARAIGTIMGMNPLPLLIPCHRVVASDGLGGYSGGMRGKGLETKRWLLELEEALPPALF